jgi:predicted nuclease of predicted toxin-antitoxin system
VKLLVDNCFSQRFASGLAAAGHDVVFAGTEWREDPGDVAIMAYAFRSRRVLVTRDQDFATLALAHGHRHAGILRIFDTDTASSLHVCVRALAEHEADLLANGVVVAFLHRSRLHQE